MAWAAALPQIIGAVGSIAGGLIGRSGQSSANSTNIALQRENQAWMERMSNTSYQRATKDLLAAGLNPMLAYSQGGASTPSSSAATVENSGKYLGQGVGDAIGKAATAIQMQRAVTENKILEEKLKQEKWITDDLGATRQDPATHPANVLAAKNRRDIGVPAEETEQAKTQTKRVATDLRIREIEERIIAATESYTVVSAKNAAELSREMINLNQLQQLLGRLDIPEKKAMADWFERVGEGSPAAKAVMTIGQWLKLILGGK